MESTRDEVGEGQHNCSTADLNTKGLKLKWEDQCERERERDENLQEVSLPVSLAEIAIHISNHNNIINSIR